MPLPAWAQPLRARLRQGWIDWGYRRQGHAGRFAQRLTGPAETPYSWPETPYPWCWGECVTPVKRRGEAAADADRLHNMQRAIDHLHGVVIEPGEILSFWHHVPRPCPGNGYRSGPMLVDGRLRSTIGGGLCQVSTTLFGALLRAGLTLLEHSNHSVDVHGEDRFFVLGQDAAVAYGFKNLLARNDHAVPLLLTLRLHRSGEPRSLEAALVAQAPCPHQVHLESRLIASLPPPSAGGRAGSRVETCRWLAPAGPGAAPPSPDHGPACDADTRGWRLEYRFISQYRPLDTLPG
jgi:vancomycin resistance protein VanW